MSDDVIVCRCEDITLSDLRRLIGQGYQTMDEIRRISRCGMGQCQGRTCRSLILGELSRALGKPIDELTLNTWRPPARPVRLQAVVDSEVGDEG